jgi:hypothetical protein
MLTALRESGGGPLLLLLRCTSFGGYRSNSGREGQAHQKREKSECALMITVVGYDVPWRDVLGPVGTVVAAEEMGSLDFLRIVLHLRTLNWRAPSIGADATAATASKRRRPHNAIRAPSPNCSSAAELQQRHFMLKKQLRPCFLTIIHHSAAKSSECSRGCAWFYALVRSQRTSQMSQE